MGPSAATLRGKRFSDRPLCHAHIILLLFVPTIFSAGGARRDNGIQRHQMLKTPAFRADENTERHGGFIAKREHAVALDRLGAH